MRIYLAAPWKHRLHAHTVAKQIRAAGHQIVSRWHDEWALRDDHETTDDEMRVEAQKDIDDVRESQVMLVLNIELSEGKAVEQGIALALYKSIVVIGHKRTNVFQYLGRVVLVETVEAALALLEKRHAVHQS